MGTILLRKCKGAYPTLCCNACPVSWAAIPAAATEVPKYTSLDNLKTLFLGS